MGMYSEAQAQPCSRLDNLWVVLGADYAGKSSILARLSSRLNCHFISYDQGILGHEYSLVGRLRDAFVLEALPGVGSVYSSDFVISLFNCYMTFLRDRILASGSDKPIVVDSYYYKILAKCVLAGFGNDSTFALWRSFPQPNHIIYLDVDTEFAWLRSGEGRRLNSLEYYGREPSRGGFKAFQNDLRDFMMKEIVGANLKKLESVGEIEDLASTIARMISSTAPARAQSSGGGTPAVQGYRQGEPADNIHP
jgi:thymidylate kinase